MRRTRFGFPIWGLGLSAFVFFLLWPGPVLAAKKVVYFSGSSPHFALGFVADAKGYFKAQGLDVSIRTFASGTEASEAFRAGGAAFLTTGDLPAIKFWELGDMVGLASVEMDPDLMVIAARKEIRSPQDLRGKKVATRMKSTGEFMVMKYLAMGKVSPKEVTIINMSPPDMVIALDRGDIDAFFVWQPYGWQAEQVSGDKVHTMGKDLINQYMILSSSKKFVQENPDTVLAFLRGLNEAGKWLKTGSADEFADLLPRYTRADKALIKRMFASMRLELIDGPVFRRDMDALADFMLKQESLKRLIRWDSDFNDSFLRKVKPSLYR